MNLHSLSRRTLAALGVVTLAAGALAACGSDDDSSPAVDATDGSAAASIVVTGAWARTSPSMASAGAAYMIISNAGETDDALVSISVDASVAARAELHETRAVDAGDMGDGMDDEMDGGMGSSEMTPEASMPDMPMMEMVHIDRVDVPAGGSVELKPGGFHVMLLDLVEPLVEGDDVVLTLTFERAGTVVVTARVGGAAP